MYKGSLLLIGGLFVAWVIAKAGQFNGDTALTCVSVVVVAAVLLIVGYLNHDGKQQSRRVGVEPADTDDDAGRAAHLYWNRRYLAEKATTDDADGQP